MKTVFDALRSVLSKPAVATAPALRQLDAQARRQVSGGDTAEKPLPRTKW